MREKKDRTYRHVQFLPVVWSLQRLGYDDRDILKDLEDTVAKLKEEMRTGGFKTVGSSDKIGAPNETPLFNISQQSSLSLTEVEEHSYLMEEELLL